MDMTIHTICALEPHQLRATMTIDKKQYDVKYYSPYPERSYVVVVNNQTNRTMTSWSKLVMIKSFIEQTWMEMGQTYGERNYG